MKEEEKFDVIVVDDAQDLLWDNDYDVFDIILKGGLKDGLWRFFADFKQSGNPEITFEKTKKTFKDKGVYYTPYSLKKNCRNTKSICDKIALVTGFKLDWEAKVGNHPDFDPKFIPYSDAEEQQEKLEEIIKQLLENKKIPQKNIAVLSYRNTDNEYKTNEKPVISRLLEKDIYKGMFKEYREQKEAAITYGTVHGFKGLENDVIILTDVNLRAFKNKEWMYLAMSRARTKLYILLDDKAHEEYEKL
jgi:superfamily I DNA/RNA helicase